MEKHIHEDKEFKNIVFQEKETIDRELENCKFINCNSPNGVFRASKFIDCVFTNCNLSMAKLNNCKLLGVNFGECADFLFSVCFDGCVLDYCSFVNKKIPRTTFLNSSLKYVDSTETDLSKATFIIPI